MRAVIKVSLSKSEALKAVNSIKPDLINTHRVKSSIRITKSGFNVSFNSLDVSSMRAALNSFLKMYELHLKVKECLNYPSKQEKS